MEPSFSDREYIIIDKLSYRLREPQRGEVIVFHPPVDPTDNYIKRIIGLPGETVRVADGNVYINNNKLDEPYLSTDNRVTEAFNLKEPITLGPDQFFVMGDNRNHSSDSREWGVLPRQEIEGRTWFVALPTDRFHFITPPTYANEK